MANLDSDLSKRLHRAVREAGLRLRNWSGPDAWMFAIYTPDDSYIGTVTLDAQTKTLRPTDSKYGTTKREREILGRVVTAWKAVA